MADALCAGAPLCPSHGQNALAACREKLTCRAFGVPSCLETGGARPRLAACCNHAGTRPGATMPHTELKSMIDSVKDGRMDRRAFIARMIGLGLTAPMATQLLAIGGVAMAQSPSPYKPTKRGGGGPLKLLWWQGPTLLNPHFATGTKDQDASRIFYEPLASWDVDGHLNPILAAEIPSIQNGELAADAKSVTWKLKPGVKWHDGKPFTADDLVFNWEYATDPATAATSIAIYRDMTVEKVDDLPVRLRL